MLIQQTKTKPQETLDFVMDKQMQSYSFSPAINLFEEGKWLLGVTSFECTISVFTIIDEKIAFQLLHQVIGVLILLKKLLRN